MVIFVKSAAEVGKLRMGRGTSADPQYERYHQSRQRRHTEPCGSGTGAVLKDENIR